MSFGGKTQIVRHLITLHVQPTSLLNMSYVMKLKTVAL